MSRKNKDVGRLEVSRFHTHFSLVPPWVKVIEGGYRELLSPPCLAHDNVQPGNSSHLGMDWLTEENLAVI